VKARSRDFVLYILVGLGVVLAFSMLALGPREYWPDDKWVPFALVTALLFGYPVRWYRRFLRSAKFWTLHLGFMLFHLVGWILFLRSINRFPYFWYAPSTGVEIICLQVLLSSVLRAAPGVAIR
jgi:hypothetical protein